MGRMWNFIVSVPDHCLFIYFSFYKVSNLCFIEEKEIVNLTSHSLIYETYLLLLIVMRHGVNIFGSLVLVSVQEPDLTIHYGTPQHYV